MSICRNLFDQLYCEYAVYCVVFCLFSECPWSGRTESYFVLFFLLQVQRTSVSITEVIGLNLDYRLVVPTFSFDLLSPSNHAGMIS